MQSYYESTTAVFNSPDYDPNVGATITIVDPFVVWIHGHPVRVEQYRKNPEVFVEHTANAASHEALHQVILAISGKSDGYKNSVSLDNPVFGGEDGIPSPCGVELATLDSWIQTWRATHR
jgi:hypothetical protein